MPPQILVIGIGNEYRSDDGAGLAAIRALKARSLPGTLLKECTSDGADLMEMWSEAKMVILIDAVSSGGNPGAIYRFDALKQPIPAQLSFQSSHVFGVAEAIELARVIDQLPPSLIVYAIEGKNFCAGVGLSSEVEKALQEVVDQMACEVQDTLVSPLLSLPATHPRSPAMFSAQASMASQSRKSPSGARTAFTIIHSAKDRWLCTNSGVSVARMRWSVCASVEARASRLSLKPGKRDSLLPQGRQFRLWNWLRMVQQGRSVSGLSGMPAIDGKAVDDHRVKLLWSFLTHVWLMCFSVWKEEKGRL